MKDIQGMDQWFKSRWSMHKSKCLECINLVVGFCFLPFVLCLEMNTMKIARILTSTAALVLLSSTSALAQKFDGTFSGQGQVIPNWATCASSSYRVDAVVSGNRLTAVINRLDGTRAGSSFTVTGPINSAGIVSLSGSEFDNLIGGRNLVFFAEVDENSVTGVVGGRDGQKGCLAVFHSVRQ